MMPSPLSAKSGTHLGLFAHLLKSFYKITTKECRFCAQCLLDLGLPSDLCTLVAGLSHPFHRVGLSPIAELWEPQTLQVQGCLQNKIQPWCPCADTLQTLGHPWVESRLLSLTHQICGYSHHPHHPALFSSSPQPPFPCFFHGLLLLNLHIQLNFFFRSLAACLTLVSFKPPP